MERYFTCPHCGADVPERALACPKCGSDDETGWSEEAKYVHLLPDRDEEELPPRRTGRGSFRQIIAAVLVAVVIAGIYLMTPGLASIGWTLPVLLIAAVIGWLIYYGVTNSPAGQERRLMQTLLVRVGGDRELAERLISFERRQNPIAERAELIEAALARLEADRR